MTNAKTGGSKIRIHIIERISNCRLLQFQHVVFDSQPHIAVGLRQASNRFRLVHLGLQHHQRYRNAAACALDRIHRGLAIDFAGGHQHANAALNQLGVLHVHVDHQVLVHVAKPRHRAGGDHVQHHLLRGAGLHARRSGNNFGPNFGHDADVGCF